MTLYKNKYRVESARLKGWDYSSRGAYYITICVNHLKCVFGEIKDGEILLSSSGKMVDKFWREIPGHFDNIVLDEFVIMPNHVHGILFIDRNVRYTSNIGIIINQFKRICTINIRKFNPEFAWQPRFYDHIIRDENDLNRIRQYIMENPLNWKTDGHYTP